VRHDESVRVPGSANELLDVVVVGARANRLEAAFAPDFPVTVPLTVRLDEQDSHGESGAAFDHASIAVAARRWRPGAGKDPRPGNRRSLGGSPDEALRLWYVPETVRL
jgi:hypothetical protein